MEVIISINEEGRLKIQTTEGMPIFTAVGMIELAKKVLLEGGQTPQVEEELEGQVSMEEVM